MKKVIILLLVFTLSLGLAACNRTPPAPSANPSAQPSANSPSGKDFRIAIITGTTAQSEDEFRGAEAAIAEFGKGADGGLILHATYPDNFSAEYETTVQTIARYKDDPLVKAIVVDQAVPGTAAAFIQIRQARPDILLFAAELQDDPQAFGNSADLLIGADNIARGYLMIDAAKKLGATKFVHISFPRHMGIDLLSRRAAIMREACKDLGLEFVMETAPDPTSEVGIPGAQQYILEQMPAWVDKYGKDSAFFCTNDAQTEPLLKMVAQLGAIFIEPDLPSPIMGYPGAFGIDLKAEAGDWPAILKKVEKTVIEAGGGGRMGTWAYSYNYTSVIALVEHARRCIVNGVKADDKADVLDCLKKYTPGALWNSNVFGDTQGNTIDNYFLLYQDTYVFGKGYLGQTSIVVPEKYFTIS